MKKGLTLIEVLLAIFVLTVGISSLIVSFNASSKQIRSSNNIFLASRFAQSKIEEFKNMAYADLADETIWDTTIIGGYEIKRTWTITAIDTPTVNAFKEISIDVNWKENDRLFHRKFVTRRSAE